MPRALVMIAKQGYQDKELEGVCEGLLDAHVEIILASTAPGPCMGTLGGQEESEIALHDAKAMDFNRVCFIGGPGAAALADDPDALRLAQEAVGAAIPLGAICIAPTILARAGVLRGKKATVWDDGRGTQIALLKKAGALYTGEPVTVDGLIATANGPDAAGEFGRVFAGL